MGYSGPGWAEFATYVGSLSETTWYYFWSGKQLLSLIHEEGWVGKKDGGPRSWAGVPPVAPMTWGTKDRPRRVHLKHAAGKPALRWRLPCARWKS